MASPFLVQSRKHSNGGLQITAKFIIEDAVASNIVHSG